MIYVSAEYMEAAKNPSRQMTAEISLDMVDATAKSDISNIEANMNDDNPRFRPVWLTVDGDYDLTQYGSCERDQFGTRGFYLLPMADDPSGFTQWGWWSGYRSDENGRFSINPTITYHLNEPHTSLGITLYLSSPVFELNIIWLGQNGESIDEASFELEGKQIESMEHGVENYYGLSVEFIRVKPNQSVKLIEIDFGQRVTYSNDEIISLNILEEVDLSSEYLSSNSFEFTLNDMEQRFNIFNPDNQAKYLQEGQIVTVTSGLLVDGEVQAIPMGQYRLSEWKSPTPYTTGFIGYDNISFLNGTWYRSRFYKNEPAYNVFQEFFAGLDYSNYEGNITWSNNQYYIHPNVRGIPLTGYVEPMEYRDALQRLLFACRAVAKVDRNGILNIYRATPEARNKPIIDEHTLYYPSYPSGSFACGQFPLLASNIEPVPNPIVIDKELSQMPSVELYDYYSQVNVDYYSWNLSNEVVTLFEGEVYGDVTVEYSSYPATSIQVTGNLASHTDYACASVLNEANGYVKITGNVYGEQKKTISKTLTEGLKGKTAEIKDVRIIGSETTANDVSEWMLNNLQNRVKQGFPWWVNPALEPSDLVKLENQYGDLMEVQVTKNSFSYVGSIWTAESEAVGPVD